MEEQEEERHDDIEECTEELGLDSDIEGFRVLDEHKENRDDSNDERSMIETPVIGMTFDSSDDAYHYYNSYARRVGFSVRKQRVTRNKHGIIRRTDLCCSCEGFYHKKNTPQKKREDRRCGCEAMLVIKLNQHGKLAVTDFKAEHNHELVPASSSHLIRSQRKIEPSQAGLIGQMHSAGLKPSQIFSYMSTEAGGAQNLNFIQADCNNFIMRRRTEFLKRGDSTCLIEYFKEKQIKDKSFFYAFRTNMENEICGCFFCDGNSRRDYAVFGDAVCFDTTFKTNNYNMVCAPIVGINNHGQTILFGCGLLDGETTEGCAWLFNVFLQAMEGKKPKTIFTDQAQSISAAIREVLPESHHRLCLWHIFQNAAKHLSHVFSEFNTFSQDFKNCIYNPETVEEFESSWETLLDDYGLKENTWLQGIYELREKWAQVYGRSHFCAGMTTTQRSESINKFLKKFFASNLILREFVVQYDKAISDRREKERLQDMATRQSKRNFDSQWKVEVEASEKYTKKLFYCFQNSYKRVLDLKLELESDDGTTRKYKSGFQMRRTLYYTPSSQSVSCSCKKFEFEGILCGHALKLFRELDLSSLPSKYYLNRWSKDARDEVNFHSLGEEMMSNIYSTSMAEYSEVSHIAQRVIVKGARDKQLCTLLKSELLKLEAKLNTAKNSEQDDAATNNDIHSDNHVTEEDESLKQQLPIVQKSRGQGTRTNKTDEASSGNHVNNDQNLKLRDPKIKKSRGRSKGKNKSGIGSKSSKNKAASRTKDSEKSSTHASQPSEPSISIEPATIPGVQSIPHPLNKVTLPSVQVIPNHPLGLTFVPGVQGAQFPYGFPTYPSIQGIPNHPHQVINPVLYNYSFMHSQGNNQVQRQGSTRQLNFSDQSKS